MRCFEDLDIGERAEFGPHVISEAEIIEFGRLFDPQPFHTDPLAAVDSAYGGLIASGLHSAGIMNRLVVDGWLLQLTSLGSPGFETMHLKLPVRPGDELRAGVEVLDLRESRSRPDRGIVHLAMDLQNQRSEVVLATSTFVFVRRREPGPDPD